MNKKTAPTAAPLRVSRRHFLAGGAALLGAPLLAGLWPKSALAQAISLALPQFTALQPAQKGPLTGAHWGAFEAIVSDDRMVGVRAVSDDPYPNELITMAPYQVHAANRIKYPMVRKHYLEGGRRMAIPSYVAATSGFASAGIRRSPWSATRSPACNASMARNPSTPAPMAGRASACCIIAVPCCNA